MALNKELINEIITITSKAAISCYDFIGKNQKKNADKAATDSMRNEINKLSINGKVVIGEGELDKAPMLYIGEKVGNGKGPEVDIALDPLEGTTICATGGNNALTVIAFSSKGGFLNAPDVYMEKLAYGPGYEPDLITLEMTPSERVEKLAKAKVSWKNQSHTNSATLQCIDSNQIISSSTDVAPWRYK